MKRICPSCSKKMLYWKFFGIYQYMKCGGCEYIFKHSNTMRWANVLNLSLLFIANYIFSGGYSFIFIMFIVHIVFAVLITQYFPVVMTSSFRDIIPPTHVEFEQTNDVSENIRRYKKAQKEAKEKSLLESV